MCSAPPSEPKNCRKISRGSIPIVPPGPPPPPPPCLSASSPPASYILRFSGSVSTVSAHNGMGARLEGHARRRHAHRQLSTTTIMAGLWCKLTGICNLFESLFRLLFVVWILVWVPFQGEFPERLLECLFIRTARYTENLIYGHEAGTDEIKVMRLWSLNTEIRLQ